MRKTSLLLIVAVLLGFCTACDLLNPKSFQLYDTDWNITDATQDFGHRSLHFTHNTYTFKDEDGDIIESGPISDEKWGSFTYTIETCTISGFEHLVGESRHAVFTLSSDTLSINFYLDDSKDTLLLSMTGLTQ